MQINITARHVKLNKPLADYIKKKVNKCQKYFNNVIWAQVILSVEKYRHMAEIIIHVSRMTFRAKEEAGDFYSAIDLTLDKIEKQLRKQKEKYKKSHKTRQISLAEMSVLEPKSKKTFVKEVKKINVKSLSVREAINEMEAIGDQFYLFLNEESSRLNLVYLKDSNSYGLVETDIYI
ncbi:MAG: ribosome-associated translation inhibitor RaiA [Endomicrobiales bacterium]|nr:ribosome-associated translation inhibitor RaiA [Endomicrobiales bacterium]